MPSDAQKLAQSVARLNRRLRQERRSDLTPTQIAVLGTLRTQGPQTPGAMAALERVQPPSMTRTLNHLVDEGLVLREPHPTDGRQVVVSIADKGLDVLAEERSRRDGWLAQQLTSLDPAERDLLRRSAAVMERLAVV
ncbi:MarR family winged helix-turn-helix transcriptional regulator [Solicola sp. PLA-1-18]|uniref:MarR family winged helix-turn-helix transcriptional regulator n=1 Tax=Solicola sp. PLA-1-18 TaxID=3380532 RepID=UPI003B810A7D